MREMASVSSIRDADFWNFARNNELCAGENLSKKMNSFQTDFHNNVPTDCYDDHTDYDVLESNKMDEILSCWELWWGRKVHTQVCNSAPQFSPCYKALDSKMGEVVSQYLEGF